MKTVLTWIAVLAAFALSAVALLGLGVWLAMATYQGIGIGQGAWIVLRGAGSVMVMATGARLARAFLKRPK